MITKKNNYILGIDEAGRGSVIGPLIIVGVLITEEQSKIMEKYIKRDSKRYTPNRREELYYFVEKHAKVIKVEKILPTEIDRLRNRNISLNEIEAKHMSNIINTILNEGYSIDKTIIDSCDTDPNRFKNRVKRYLQERINIVTEHKADEKYTVVSAASIIAKVIRDREIKSLEKKYGEIGSGYPSDPITRNFIEKNLDKTIDIIRYTWKTLRKLG
jgi:ribonuclease HII